MTMIYIRVKLKPSLAPAAERFTWKERFIALRGIWGIALLALIVMGGIYSGLFTPTEAGAVGAFGAFVSALALRKISWNSLLDCLKETTKTTGSIFLIIIAAFAFGYLMGITRLPTHASEFLTSLPYPPVIIVSGIMVFYVILGAFMDLLAAMFLTLPIVLPAIVKMGYDPIWFGVLMVFMCEVAQVSPPFGLNLFVIKGTMPGIPMQELYLGALPVLVTQIFILVIYIAFPQAALFLPSLM
jgi:tripartite ATP-independent transporter DctM subunit